MNYLDKYIKYKNKYLELKLQQIGGEVPIISTIRNIELIENKCIKQFLDPLWGFIYINNGFIFNYYHFYDKDDKSDLIGKIINKIFDRNLILTEDIRLEPNITPKFIGNIISYLYLWKFYNIEIDIKKDIAKDDCKEIIKKIIQNKINIKKNIKRQTIYEVFNIIKKCSLDQIVDAFRTLLIILWYKANNKDGIKDYYEGINEIFMYYNFLVEDNKKIKIINIPDDFLDINKKGSNFQEELMLFSSEFYIFEQNNFPNICNVNFPDCGEQTIRNFINMICFNDTNFDINILKKLNANCKLIEYYSVFNDFSKQKNDNYTIFGRTFNGRTAWNYIVCDLKNVKYSNRPQVCILNGKQFSYNITDGLNLTNTMPNLFQVIINLFEGINTFNELIIKLKDNNIINNVLNKIDENGFGRITFDIKNWEFTMFFIKGHYYVENFIKLVKENNSLNDEEKEIINILRKTPNNKIIINKNFMYKKWTKENLIYIMNYMDIDENIYNKIFRYIYKLDEDVHRRILLKFNLIKNLLKYDLRFFGVGYNCTDKEKIIVSIIIQYNKPLNISLCKFTNLNNLKKLILNYFNQPLGTSLNNLNNLEELIIGNIFNKPLYDSLYKLTNLKILTLGDSFNESLGTSLNNLTKLETLTLGNSFNQSLGTSLNNLSNLKKLTFGNNFNIELIDSLNNLTKLETLTFGEKFNNQKKQLNESFKNLISLKTLTFGNNFNLELVDSLNNLINLETLTFGNSFNNKDRPLESSLDELISLQNLTFGTDFNNGRKPLLIDSFIKLSNLKTLTLSQRFNNMRQPLYLPNIKLNFPNEQNPFLKIIK